MDKPIIHDELDPRLEEYERACQAVNALLYEPGEACDYGLPLHQREAAIASARLLSAKPYCLVTDWTWWDLDMANASDAIHKSLADGLQAAVLKVDSVLEESQPRLTCGSMRRSSLLKKHHYSAFFESEHTLYVLMGHGTRKTVDGSLAMGIYL